MIYALLQLLRGVMARAQASPARCSLPSFSPSPPYTTYIHWLQACLRLPLPRVTAPLPSPQAPRSISVRGSTYNGKGPGPDQICRRGPNLCSTLPAVSGAGERLFMPPCAKMVYCCPVDQTKKRGTCYAALSLRFEARSSPCKHPRCRLCPLPPRPICVLPEVVDAPSVSINLGHVGPSLKCVRGKDPVFFMGPPFTCVYLQPRLLFAPPPPFSLRHH
jgi:hypothetical protein